MTYNFPDHERGDTFKGVGFELIVNGVAKSLAGATIIMTIAGKEYSTTNGSLVVTDAPSGKFEFKEQIVSMSPKTHYYEIVFYFSDGSVKTYIEGTWKITA